MAKEPRVLYRHGQRPQMKFFGTSGKMFQLKDGSLMVTNAEDIADIDDAHQAGHVPGVERIDVNATEETHAQMLIDAEEAKGQNTRPVAQKGGATSTAHAMGREFHQQQVQLENIDASDGGLHEAGKVEEVVHVEDMTAKTAINLGKAAGKS